jgi:Uri superfamily endonuclease
MVSYFGEEEVACYFLFIRLEEDTPIEVGKKGTILFRRGFYCYVGRAKRNVVARLRRHLRQKKRKHWHIDFLLQKGKITWVVLLESDAECFLADFLRRHPLVEDAVFGFGSSDCRCPSHLFFLGEHCAPSVLLRGIPCPFRVVLIEKEALHHPGVPDRIVPKAVVEHEEDFFGLSGLRNQDLQPFL